MNYAQLAGAVRAVLAAFGGGLVTKGIVSSDQLSSTVDTIITVGGGLVTLGTTLWSIHSNHSSQLAKQLALSKQPLSDQMTK